MTGVFAFAHGRRKRKEGSIGRKIRLWNTSAEDVTQHKRNDMQRDDPWLGFTRSTNIFHISRKLPANKDDIIP
jgi:hypothetical protein